ncbi:nuclear transport factor 2 family protein [Bacteroidota bacterium]
MKNNIQYIFYLSIIFFCFSCGIDQKNQNNSDSDKEQLRYLKEIEWPKAYANQDTILLDRILGEEFKMIDNSGNWYSKKDELEWIKNNVTAYDSFYYEIKRLDILENGTALLCGTAHIKIDSVRSIYESSNVLIKREGQWKAVLSHVSGFKNIEKE